MAALLEGLAGGLAGAAKGLGGVADAEVKRRELAAKAKTEIERLDAQFKRDLAVANVKHGYRVDERIAADKTATERLGLRRQNDLDVAKAEHGFRTTEQTAADTAAMKRRIYETEHRQPRAPTSIDQKYALAKRSGAPDDVAAAIATGSIDVVKDDMGNATFVNQLTQQPIGRIKNGKYIPNTSDGAGGATLNEVSEVYKAKDGRFVGVTPRGAFYITEQQARAAQSRIGSGGTSGYQVPPPQATAAPVRGTASRPFAEQSSGVGGPIPIKGDLIRSAMEAVDNVEQDPMAVIGFYEGEGDRIEQAAPVLWRKLEAAYSRAKRILNEQDVAKSAAKVRSLLPEYSLRGTQ